MFTALGHVLDITLRQKPRFLSTDASAIEPDGFLDTFVGLRTNPYAKYD